MLCTVYSNTLPNHVQYPIAARLNRLVPILWPKTVSSTESLRTFIVLGSAVGSYTEYFLLHFVLQWFLFVERIEVTESKLHNF